MKIRLFLLIFLFSSGYSSAQEKNFHTTLGFGVVTSIPFGDFKSKINSNPKSGYAFNEYDGFKFTLQQNLGSKFGVSLNFYSLYYKFDLRNFEKALLIDNRGLAPDNNLIYEIPDTFTEWYVNIGNIGFYYYKYVGAKKKIMLSFIGALTITDMISPTFDVNIKDPSNNLLETRHIEMAHTWREVFFLFPPIDGFSLEANANYFFSKHFSIYSTVSYINSKGIFDGNQKALINLSSVNYSSLNIALGINYTIFYNKQKTTSS